MALSAHDELILLRKRARRRLVGAVVLVTVSTGVLWNVVGHLPEQQMRPESVEIASEASGTPADAALPPAETVAGASSAPLASKVQASAAHLAAASAPAAKPAGTQLPADLASVEPDRPAAAASHAAPAVAAVAAVGAVAAVQASKPKPAETASQPTVHEPVKKKIASKPAESKPVVAHAEKPPKADSKPLSKPEQPKRKQADPAAILAGHFDEEPAAKTSPAKTSPTKKSESKPEKVDNVASGKSSIQLAALSDPAKADALKSKLAGLGIAAHFSKVETSKGEVTRVRVGPFASRAEAEAALHKLSQAGVSGIIVNK
ncbi:SPOR domain-containing protein [Aquitalea aquatica]|uniref:SPOR domain-containing protein n=1 Tax=Aquitalea aquatica TaxID=3044273 RepID=A0A838YC33_9NEIS|nr:SPOR domain-containing protein [Aquitalea magnusonii]MBA4708605.1 SPOR domain-containing protein [Aquitalea magnusonii]